MEIIIRIMFINSVYTYNHEFDDVISLHER